jgi:hypothetical protein
MGCLAGFPAYQGQLLVPSSFSLFLMNYFSELSGLVNHSPCSSNLSQSSRKGDLITKPHVLDESLAVGGILEQEDHPSLFNPTCPCEGHIGAK